MNMNFSIHRPIGSLLAAGFAAFVLALSPSTVSAQQPAPKVKDMQGKTAGQFYKNVKVLKDLPAVDIHPAMEYITVALGVGCPYCHDMRKFDDDGKPTKRSARNMMQMMFALDNTAFAGKREVTCYTCHRGAPIGASAELLLGQKPPMEPPATNDRFPNIAIPNLTLDSSMGPVRPGPGDPPIIAPNPNAPKPAPVTLPSADDVLSKYEQAVGSSAAVKKASTIVEKGTVEMIVPNPPGVAGPPQMGHPSVEIDRKAPDKAVQTIQMPNGPAMQGYDGQMGWLAGGVGRELMGGELQTVQDWAEFIPAFEFKEEHNNVSVAAADKIGGHDVYVVTGVAKNGSGLDRLYFDSQSGLLVRAVTNMNSVLGAFPETTDFDDYRDVSGVKMAYTVKLMSAEGTRTYKFDSIEINTPVEDAKFQQPPPRPPAPPAGGPAGGTPPGQ
jgi:photosynthetic reaction center cytochrome c subunit